MIKVEGAHKGVGLHRNKSSLAKCPIRFSDLPNEMRWDKRIGHSASEDAASNTLQFMNSILFTNVIY